METTQLNYTKKLYNTRNIQNNPNNIVYILNHKSKVFSTKAKSNKKNAGLYYISKTWPLKNSELATTRLKIKISSKNVWRFFVSTFLSKIYWGLKKCKVIQKLAIGSQQKAI